MVVAVAFENGLVFQHFGHSAQFKLYEIENNTVVSERVVPTNGSGHGALAGFLKANGVHTLICGGIGGGAKAALAEAGIRLYPGVSGRADDQVAALLNGTLQYQPDIQCTHHEEGHGSGHCHSHDHTCGQHCGK